MWYHKPGFMAIHTGVCIRTTVRRRVVPHAGARGNTHRSVYQGHSPKTCGAPRRSAWQYTPECVSGPQSEDMWRHTPERVAIHTGVCIRATVRRHVAPHAGARGNTHRSVYQGHSPKTCGTTCRSMWQAALYCRVRANHPIPESPTLFLV